MSRPAPSEPDVTRWLQVGLRPASNGVLRRKLYGRIGELARTLLTGSAADNFFFMHKAPGLRLRFERPDAGPDGLSPAVYDEVARWSADGLVEQVEPGVYEPESSLFGGPESMRFVHPLFTVDSLAWLDLHALPVQGGDTSAAWTVSLAMLREIFDGLDITGWEDLGVWERIRDATGRRLGSAETSVDGYHDVAQAIRATWRQPLPLPTAVRAIVADHRDAVRPALARWLSGYFHTREARVGPRAAAVYYVVFHWNRAGIPATRQALLTESLARWEMAQ